MILFQQAFRICFLGAALWSAAALPLWLFAYAGTITIAEAYGDVWWHGHEMIFGYVAMVICGFLFTAIPNWTGRPPIGRGVLVGLVLAWLAGRAAMVGAATIGLTAAAILDLSFLLGVLLVAGRELVAGRNWRNLRVLALITCLMLANGWFHGAALLGQSPAASLRAAVAALVALITLVGGRLTPTFTRNWLVKQGATRLPAPFGKLDALAIAAATAGAALWAWQPEGFATAIVAAVAAALLTARLLRWRGGATLREPLLLILHVGYAFLPLGFALLALAGLRPDLVPAPAITHVWTAGAVGTMTLAVMTRASLGHVGRPLTATRGTQAIYAAILTAAALRLAAALAGGSLTLLGLAGIAWSAAFIGFAIAYGPMLARPRRQTT